MLYVVRGIDDFIFFDSRLVNIFDKSIEEEEEEENEIKTNRT